MSTFSNPSFGAANYAKFRPTYPSRLYEHIIGYHVIHNKSAPKVVVDFGCGTGQATKALGNHGQKVLGLDPSNTMIEQALKEDHAENIDFAVCNENSLETKLGKGSVDLLTAGEAAHYFAWPQFWERAAAILKPGGTLALFSYWTFAFPDYPEVAQIIDEYAYADDKCGPYWDSGREYLDREYIDIKNAMDPSKFEDLEYRVNHFDKFRPEEPFELIKRDISVQDVISMLKTWSSYFNYKAANPNDPDIANAVLDDISKVTGLTADSKVTVKWNTVYILATRK